MAHTQFKGAALAIKLVFVCLFASAGPDEPGDPFRRFADGDGAQSIPEAFDGKFNTQAGETIAWIGGENLVRQQNSGILESAFLSVLKPGGEVPVFRPMTWEGDTVYAMHRDLNFGEMEEQLRWSGATSVWLQMGTMEALAGVESLPEFVAGLSRLLDRVASVTPRIVVLSPSAYEKSSYPHGPDLVSANIGLGQYVEAMRQAAESRGFLFVDLFKATRHWQSDVIRQTDNGIHWNRNGQSEVAEVIVGELFPERPRRGQVFNDLIPVVSEKNRLWFDCWRPMNWAFAYGDRTSQLFSQPEAGSRWLKEEFEIFKKLIRDRDAQIASIISGRPHIVLNATDTGGVPDDAEERIQNPQDVLDSFQVQDGFAINLFASEELGVVNPTQIAWDSSGKLYIACSPTYPHIIPGRKPGDYVLVCVDDNRDGVADRSYRYAEGLHMVQGLEPFPGGLYVCAGTELRRYSDRDGDGLPEDFQVMLSGFGTGDAHQLVNSICHGPDGFLWFTQGLHILSHIETVWGVSTLEKSGVWRFDPSSGKLDGFFNGGRAGHNCWGVAFDDNNQAFHKTGDRPDGYYMVPGWFPIASPAEYHPTGSLFQTPVKTTSIDFIGTSALPESMQGGAVLGGFMKHTVEWYSLHDDGAGFKSVRESELVISSAEEFRPVDVSVGPDGAVYVCDFHNRLIGHYQTSYRDPGRDQQHGRIWRIASKEKPSVEYQPVSSDPAQLVNGLFSPDRWVRDQSRKALYYADPEAVVAALDLQAERLSANPETRPAYARLAMQSLGIYRRHHVRRPEMVEFLARSEDSVHRAYAARMAGFQGLDPVIESLSRDLAPRVRLESLVASVHARPTTMGKVFFNVYSRGRDRFLDYALINAARFMMPVIEKHHPLELAKLSPDVREFMEASLAQARKPVPAGQAVYERVCLNCHQPDGRGLEGIYPSLADSRTVAGATDRLAAIIIFGLAGPLESGGHTFNNVMPPAGLTDQDAADVINYIRRNFGGLDESPAAPESVKSVRDRFSDRRVPWSVNELDSAFQTGIRD